MTRSLNDPMVATCPRHPGTALVTVTFCPKCRGEATSEKKADASRRNGQLGGRPRKKPKPQLTPAQDHRYGQLFALAANDGATAAAADRAAWAGLLEEWPELKSSI